MRRLVNRLVIPSVGHRTKYVHTNQIPAPTNTHLTKIVPACKQFTITWEPTTPNTISLILLRGPSSNVVPISTIVTGITNSGSYAWIPVITLQADTTRYGIQLIHDVTGQYQYSTQFGIGEGSNCDGVATPSSSANSSSTPSSTPSNKPQDQSRPRSKLKPGIAAAIGISVTVGITIFAIAVFMAYKCGRRRDTTAAQKGDAVVSLNTDLDTKVEYLKPELHAQSVGELHGQHVMHELHGGSVVINELASPVAELCDERVRRELDAGEGGK